MTFYDSKELWSVFFGRGMAANGVLLADFLGGQIGPKTPVLMGKLDKSFFPGRPSRHL